MAGATLACGQVAREATPVAQTQATATSAPTPSPPVSTPVPIPIETAAFLPDQEADLVLHAGKILTVDPQDSILGAVALRDGRIVAVGGDEEVLALAGPLTQKIDLAGRAVTPGLIDAHNHLQVMGLMHGYYTPFLPPEVRTLEDLRARLAEIVAQTPEGEWVQGYFMVVNEGRLPSRQDLDPVSPDHPVWIMQQGGHYGSANSLALQMAGITADTPDPVGGVIERDTGGEPTGVFYNHRAMDVLRRVIPRYTQEMVRENIVSSQPLFAACGVTSFQDNNVRGTDTVATYLDAGRRGDMSLRGAVYYTLEWPQDLDRALHEIPLRRWGRIDALCRFQVPARRPGQDGLLPRAARRRALGYADLGPSEFQGSRPQLHDTGLQICVHCAGDAAVDLTLDAYEEAMNANPRPDPRHRIEHCILSTPQATQRMTDLGVVVSTQPQFLRLGGDAYTPLYGEERSRRAIVTREWLDAGVPVALGSDAPTTPWYTPQITLFGAVTRVTASNQRHEPDQALTIQEALRAHTMGSAYAAHEEGVKGSIEVGKLADLAVWSEDPTTAPLQRLWQIPIDMTIVGGRLIYEGT